MKTLNKHVKWRKDNQAIFICDCKRFIDLKVGFDYEDFMNKLSRGIDVRDLLDNERLIYKDFDNMKMLAELEIKPLALKDFSKAMAILENELDGRVRTNRFLKNKYNNFKDCFIGAYLDGELIGIICGFPRDDYFLLSEIAVDCRFIGRGIGTKLIREFEKAVKKKGYKKINVGAHDNSIKFYLSDGYKPFILAQGNLSKELLEQSDVGKTGKGYAEIEIKKPSIEKIKILRDEYPEINFQYIFSKSL